jgi:16S rRNA G966 N2-methylase RsmD
VRELALESRTRVLELDIYRGLPGDLEPFDVIFLDPPFVHYEAPERTPWQLLARLGEGRLLTPGGRIGLETPSRLDPPDVGRHLSADLDRAYGDTRILLWKKTG